MGKDTPLEDSDLCVDVVKLTLPVPPLLNDLYRRSRTGRVYKIDTATPYAWDVKAIGALNKVKAIKGDVVLNIAWFRKRKAGDIDAILKCLLDSLQGTLYENDSQVAVLSIVRGHDPKNPRVEIMAYKRGNT